VKGWIFCIAVSMAECVGPCCRAGGNSCRWLRRARSASSIGEYALVIHTQTAHIDTNTTAHYSATLASGETAQVRMVGFGRRSQCRPGVNLSLRDLHAAHYLTRESVAVEVRAQLEESTNAAADTG
jgi:hypothetical protein